MDNQSIIKKLTALWEKEYPWQSTKNIYKFDWEVRTIQVKKIRASTPKHILKARGYKELMEKGEKFPPIVVICQKKDSERYRLIDGFHRMWAYKKLETDTVVAYIGTKKGKNKNENLIAEVKERLSEVRIDEEKMEAEQTQPEIFSDKGLYN